ncbi:hypothetical protein GCM10009867_03200 [Pedococcus aerophilus]|uniref:Uncharacterized protein n=1 Tax=Pedococcus aerophilus TaxID=436356 RepID=A0ABP6GUN5_9MICO
MASSAAKAFARVARGRAIRSSVTHALEEASFLAAARGVGDDPEGFSSGPGADDVEVMP